ncbi:MAG: hypothetical protein K8S25_12690 [Alphaproteobacteria bacterium]|nr:hypothetical protein [Alphaproteobacteria bacterium]
MRLAMAFLFIFAWSQSAFAAERERSILVGGLTRKYALITPDKVTTLLPLLIVYHGGNQSSQKARRYTRFDEMASKENIAVVYPQGLDNNWNDGRRSADLSQRAAANADDVELTRQIIGQLEIEGLINASRVFLAGASSGGMMALRAGCELDTRISGLAAVAANLPVDWRCRASRMPALFIHGTADTYMPFAGGPVSPNRTLTDWGRVRSVDETIAEFKRINACTGVKETKSLDKVGRDNTKAVITDYECKKAPLKHIVIEGGGHTWPGARESILGDLASGNTSDEVDATAEIWSFFKALPAR